MSTEEFGAWNSMNPLRDELVSGVELYTTARIIGEDFIRSKYEVYRLLDCHSTKR